MTEAASPPYALGEAPSSVPGAQLSMLGTGPRHTVAQISSRLSSCGCKRRDSNPGISLSSVAPRPPAPLSYAGLWGHLPHPPTVCQVIPGLCSCPARWDPAAPAWPVFSQTSCPRLSRASWAQLPWKLPGPHDTVLAHLLQAPLFSVLPLDCRIIPCQGGKVSLLWSPSFPKSRAREEAPCTWLGPRVLWC